MNKNEFIIVYLKYCLKTQLLFHLDTNEFILKKQQILDYRYLDYTIRIYYMHIEITLEEISKLLFFIKDLYISENFYSTFLLNLKFINLQFTLFKIYKNKY